jgi:hypothetical protein
LPFRHGLGVGLGELPKAQRVRLPGAGQLHRVLFGQFDENGVIALSENEFDDSNQLGNAPVVLGDELDPRTRRRRRRGGVKN